MLELNLGVMECSNSILVVGELSGDKYKQRERSITQKYLSMDSSSLSGTPPRHRHHHHPEPPCHHHCQTHSLSYLLHLLPAYRYPHLMGHLRASQTCQEAYHL